MTTKTDVLTPGDAIALATVLAGIQGNQRVKWLDAECNIAEGEFRSLVMGENNFAMLQWGTDVRDAHVWITSNGFERTEPMRRLMMLATEGGLLIGDDV